MGNKLIITTVSLFLMLGVAVSQETTKTTHKKTRTITGCLQKGDGADEYQLTTKAGSTWELKSDSVKFANHVGHEVRVYGAVANAKLHGMKEDTKEEMKEHGVDKGAREHGHLTVTGLKMISTSCRK